MTSQGACQTPREPGEICSRERNHTCPDLPGISECHSALCFPTPEAFAEDSYTQSCFLRLLRPMPDLVIGDKAKYYLLKCLVQLSFTYLNIQVCFYILTQDATCISCCESQLKGLKAEKPCYDGMSITFLASLYVSTSFIPAIAEYLSKPFCAYVMTPPLPFHLPGPAAVLFDSTPLKNLNPLPIRAHHTFLFVPIVHFHIPLFSIFHSA